MRQLSNAGQQAINDIAQRHGFSADAVLSMLDSVIRGNGGMAQFSHPEFAGSGQWMRGGMTMVSDMFNHQLKGRVDALCSELANLVANQPDLVRSGSFQSQNQGGGYGSGQAQTGYGGYQTSQNYGNDIGSNGANGANGSNNSSSSSFGSASLFVPPAPGSSGDWWPADLRFPNSTGAQNGVRYACFAQARRLAIELNGSVTVYDTLDHDIGGFSQQQSYGGTLSFNSQYGLVDVASLPVLSVNGVAQQRHQHSSATAVNAPSTASTYDAPPYDAPWQQPASGSGWPDAAASASFATSSGQQQQPQPDVFATLEKLADLRSKGILSDEEFAAKKSELLSRV